MAQPSTASPKPRAKRIRARAKPKQRPARSAAPKGALHTLSIDIGGTGIKMLVLDHQGKPVNERHRELTPDPATPKAVLAVIERMLGQQPAFHRVSVGFPG